MPGAPWRSRTRSRSIGSRSRTLSGDWALIYSKKRRQQSGPACQRIIAHFKAPAGQMSFDRAGAMPLSAGVWSHVFPARRRCDLSGPSCADQLRAACLWLAALAMSAAVPRGSPAVIARLTSTTLRCSRLRRHMEFTTSSGLQVGRGRHTLGAVLKRRQSPPDSCVNYSRRRREAALSHDTIGRLDSARAAFASVWIETPPCGLSASRPSPRRPRRRFASGTSKDFRSHGRRMISCRCFCAFRPTPAAHPDLLRRDRYGRVRSTAPMKKRLRRGAPAPVQKRSRPR